MDLFSESMRRNPFTLYAHMRATAPVFRVPPPFDMWMIFDYENAKRVASDFQAFSSAVPAPDNWFIFQDPPQHAKMRALISRAFTPKSIAGLEPRIEQLSREILDRALPRGEMDLAVDYAVPLPMKVIAELIGIPSEDWTRFRRWSDSILKLSYTMKGMESDSETATAMESFRTASAEMNEYLAGAIAARRANPQDDLLTRLVEAEVDGERLSQYDILGFFQLLVVGGQETTANLINNAVISLLEFPGQLKLLRRSPELIPSAVEEALRFRSPIQWLMRTPTQDISLSGQLIPKRSLILVMVGSANRDEKIFAEPDRFDICRAPNPHIAFGHGIHACLGAALARMEARIALGHLLSRMTEIGPASAQPWPPRKALNVHGPASLPIRFAA